MTVLAIDPPTLLEIKLVNIPWDTRVLCTVSTYRWWWWLGEGGLYKVVEVLWVGGNTNLTAATFLSYLRDLTVSSMEAHASDREFKSRWNLQHTN